MLSREELMKVVCQLTMFTKNLSKAAQALTLGADRAPTMALWALLWERSALVLGSSHDANARRNGRGKDYASQAYLAETVGSQAQKDATHSDCRDLLAVSQKTLPLKATRTIPLSETA